MDLDLAEQFRKAMELKGWKFTRHGFPKRGGYYEVTFPDGGFVYKDLILGMKFVGYVSQGLKYFPCIDPEMNDGFPFGYYVTSEGDLSDGEVLYVSQDAKTGRWES